jgi:hypothetical protein
LVEGGELAGIDTIADVIPPPEIQQAVVDRLIEAAPDLADLRPRFEDALRRNGLNPVPFREGIDHLVTALGRRRPLSLEDLEGTALARVVDRYMARAGGEYSAAMYLYPPRGSWRQGAPPGLVDVLAAFPDGALSGVNVISAELRRIVWQDAVAALVLGLIGVYLLMWADLGSSIRTLLALLPLALGMVWMLGAMAVLDIRLNFFNIFVLTMIVGIGVDYGVHLIHRWAEAGDDPDRTAATAKAITVAALTTMVGFGSLVVSHFPGLRSVGAAAMLGAAATAVLAITVLPALLTIKERSHDS